MEKSGFLLTSKLPAPFAFGRTGLTYDGQMLSNYCPVVTTVKIYVNGDKPEPHVVLKAILKDGTETSEISVPLRDLKALDIQADLDYRCCDVTDKSRSFVHRLIRSLAAQQQAVEVYRANTLGFLHYDGRVAYNAGSKLIGNLGVEVELRTSGYHFCPPTDVPDKQLAAHIRAIVQLKPQVTAPIFAYFILGILRDLFREAGVQIKFCMFLYGKQQSMKTTLATYLCSLYDRHEDVERHLHNLTASEAALHKILKVEKDMVSVIDDLNLDDSKKKEREQTAKISGLIRAAANDVGRKTLRGEDSINAQPLFCGEYLLRNPSTNNRLLILHLEQGMIDKQKLLEIQQDANLLTAFAEEFIVWVINHYQTLCKLIRNQYDSIMELRAGGIFYQERLNRSGAAISIAFGIFLKFCKMKCWNVGLSAQVFTAIITNVLEQQVEYLNLQGKDEPDYTVEIFKLLREASDCGLVKRGRPKNKTWKSQIYYDDDQEHILIRSEEMGQMSLKLSEELNKTFSVHALLDALDAEGIIIKDNNINGTRSKKVGNERCYVLDYARLKNYVQEVAEEFESEYGDWS